MDRYDALVIGGGLLGCFTARNLARYRLKTVLLEAREDVCTGISRANTAIIYSGYDTKPGTLKTQMCVKAAQSYENLCSELGVRYSPCGSIMVCFGPNGEKTLRKKFEQGQTNGVRGMKLLRREEVLALEPRLATDVRMGLFAPEAGTVIPWELGLAAAENAARNGVEFLFGTKVTAINKISGGYEVCSGNRTFETRSIVNCAGLYADEILEMISNPSVRIIPDAGDYYVLDTKASGSISHVIFHESEEKGKGLTLVPTVDGNILLGPTKIQSARKDGFKTSHEGLSELKALAAKVIPGLPMEQVIRSFGAIRPNPYHTYYDADSETYVPEKRGISEFTISESEEAPGFLSMIGIKTPGLTCSNELGLYAAERIATLLGAEPNISFDPKRAAHLKLGVLPLSQRARLISENPAYGNIVCRCRQISEGEIIDCVRQHPDATPSQLLAVTLDGVKRRTGAGSGRCQGSFCSQRILEIIAREQHRAVGSINKDGPGSYLISGGDGNAV